MATSRPFSLLSVHHVALGCRSLAGPLRLWSGLLNASLQGFSESAGTARTVLRLPHDGSEVHLLEGSSAGGAPLRSLHHVGLAVDALGAAREHLAGHGVRIVEEEGASAPSGFYIHPKGHPDFSSCGEGCLVHVGPDAPSACSGAVPADTAAAAAAATAAYADKPFRVLGLQQLAVGGEDKAKLSMLWQELLGLQYKSTYVSESENVDEDILVLGEAGPREVEVDIMQPLDATRAPRVHVPPLNHIGLWVDNIADAVSYMGDQGVRFAPGGIRAGAAGFDVAFLHPKGNEAAPMSGEGVLIELVQAPAEVIEHHAGRD